jgi:hypothetical protein
MLDNGQLSKNSASGFPLEIARQQDVLEPIRYLAVWDLGFPKVLWRNLSGGYGSAGMHPERPTQGPGFRESVSPLRALSFLHDLDHGGGGDDAV